MDRYDTVRALLLLILLVGAGVRIANLGGSPLWAGEAMWAETSAELVEQPRVIPRYLETGRPLTGHPPVYFHLNTLAYIAGDPGEAALRLLSALAGALTGLIIYLLGRRFYDENTGLMAAAFLAVSSNHVLYSRQVHPTALGVFLMASSVYLAVKAAQTGETKMIGAAAGTALLAVSTHYMAAVLLLLFPAIFYIEQGWRQSLTGERSLLGGYIALVVATSIHGIWNIVNAYPATMLNPVRRSRTSVFQFISGLRTEIATVGGGLWRLISFYFSPSFLYLPPLLALVPVTDAGRPSRAWRDSPDGPAAGSRILYLWILITAAILTGVVLLYRATGLDPVRSHPFLVIPLLLLAARGSVLLYRRSQGFGILPVLLLLTYLTHLPAVMGIGVVNPDIGGSMVRNAMYTVDSVYVAVDTDLDQDQSLQELQYGLVAPNVSVEFSYDVYLPKMFVETESIVCTGEYYRPLFCFNRHPVGFNDALDWDNVTAYLDAQIQEGETVYASRAGPVRYYSDSPVSVTDLICNIGHRGCNISRAVDNDTPFWIVVTADRFAWQFTSNEKRKLQNSCNKTVLDYVWIFHCR
ncbi:MAG: glycosyltransferase family 39 protein [Candidatus Nanohaloarchaea archaeon]|nr:glycosyltransferase family 39 protein [Candidatus Nanohaloarchaea archaeon]